MTTLLKQEMRNGRNYGNLKPVLWKASENHNGVVKRTQVVVNNINLVSQQRFILFKLLRMNASSSLF